MFDIHDRIDLWHETPEDGVPLHEFLGFTWDEYGRWVAGRMSRDELESHGYLDPWR